MHDTALLSGMHFFQVYGKAGSRILDVGSMDVNGTLRPYAPPESKYIGLDLTEGAGVDVVFGTDGWPFDQGEFDLVVSTSAFEHDKFFWVTFGDMARVSKLGGYIYISAPANGEYHAYPLDCWRFYPDAARALAEWANYRGYPLVLLENFALYPIRDQWIDRVMIFGRSNAEQKSPSLRDILLAQGCRVE